MRRTRDSDLVSRIVGTDFTEFLAEPLNVCLIEGESICFFAWRGPGIYEVHIHFQERGRAAINLLGSFVNSMVDMWGATFFWGMIPLTDRKVRMFGRLAGWKSTDTLETRHGPCELFVLENV